jgi:hypothetical protein
VLFVRAATPAPGVYFDSPADSGYSVDNLPPAPPAPFTAAYSAGATHLSWGRSTEPDFWYYNVYRGSVAAFTPGAGNRIATRSDTGYDDAGTAGSYYEVTAVDVNGNESAPAALTPAQTAGVGEAPLAFALGRVSNPSPDGLVRVSFTLPAAGAATLELLDVGGRRVAAREVGALGAGAHKVALAGERRLAAGVYFVRLTQGAKRATARVTILD